MQTSQLSQRRGPVREAGLLPSQRTRPFTALGYAGCSSRAVAQRRRRASGVLAAAEGPSSTQGNQSPPPPPPQPQAPRSNPSWLARAVGQAALLLPLTALSLGILGPRSAAWAKPPVQGPAPVAQRTDASELIDENTGTVQQWLYTRGPWNQRQYGTIHKFYTDRQAAEAEQVAGYATATAGATAVQQGPAAEQQAGAPSAAATAIGAQLLPTRTVSGSGASAAPAAGIPSHVSDALAHLNQLGARVTDAVSGVSLSSVNLNGVNMNDPQVQRSAAVVGATIIALLMFWGRQAQHAQHMSSEAGGNAGSSYDAASDGVSKGSNADDKPAAAAAATAVAAAAATGGLTDIYTKEEVQVLAQQRIEAGKLQVAEEQRRLAEASAAGAAGAAVTAGAAGAQQARHEAAEVVVLTDMEVIADGGSVGKFTTDAAAARAISDEAHAQAAASAEAAAAKVAATAAAAAQAEAEAAAAAEAEKQRAAAASLEAAAAEERRQQEAETARMQASAQAGEQRAAAASLEAAAAKERQQQKAEAAARAAQVATVESTAVMVATAAGERPVIGSSFGVDPATEEGATEPQPAAAPAPAAATAVTSGKPGGAAFKQPVVAPVPATLATTAAAAPVPVTAAATAMSAPPPVTGTAVAAPATGTAAGVPPNVSEARAWIAAWKGKAAAAEVAEPKQVASKPLAAEVAPAEVAPQHAPSMAQAATSTTSGMSGFFAAAANMFRGFGSRGNAAAATGSRAAAAAAPTLTAGAMLTIGSAPGDGRSLEAATGRAVAAALAAVAADAQRSAAAAVSAAVLVEALQQQEVPAVLASAASASAAAGHKKQWDPVSLLLAPAAPLLAGLPSGSASGSAKGAKGGNKYDMLLSMLSAAAAAPAVQEDSRYDPVRAMLAAVPSSGVPRYDFARSLLRGMVSEDSSSDDGAFDMANGLLKRVRSGEVVPTGGSSYDPVWALLKEAALLEEWGMLSESRYDPWSGLTDWVGPVPAGTPSRYDPWKDLVQAAREGQQAFEASKYARDPLRQFIRDFAAPKGASRYDPAVGLFALAGSEWQGPTGRDKYCMVAAALDAAAGWEVPTGDSRYCPMSDFLNAAEGWEAPAGRGSFDPLAWLLNGWAGGWQQPAGSRSKYDPAALVLKAQPALHSDRAKFDPLSHLTAGDFSISPPEASPTRNLFRHFTGGARGHDQQPASEPELVQAVPSGMSDWN